MEDIMKHTAESSNRYKHSRSKTAHCHLDQCRGDLEGSLIYRYWDDEFQDHKIRMLYYPIGSI